MKDRLWTLLAMAMLVLGMTAGPAMAHTLVVDPPGNDDTMTMSEIGGGALPEEAQGEGLIPGGPEGSYQQTPAPSGGLVVA